MKKVRLIVVGSIKDSERHLARADEEYVKRLSRFCDFEIIEVAAGGKGSGSGANGSDLEKEADAILKVATGRIILFDVAGELVTSEGFADLIDKSYLAADTISFIIGGSEGVAARVKKVAAQKVSFGRVTYPHRLMRLLATEQIYRAFTILARLPYHK